METLTIRGIPTRTWKSAPATLRSVLELSTLHGDKDFLVYEDERVTFAEHFRIVAGLAHTLIDRLRGLPRATGWPSPCATCPSGSWPSGPPSPPGPSSCRSMPGGPAPNWPTA